MASNHRSADVAEGELDGTGLRIGVVCGRFNDLITKRLLEGTERGLRALGVSDSDVLVVWVPGAFEIPITASAMIGTGRFDAVIGLGCVIRGDTAHFDFVAGECASGIQRVQLDTGVPVVFGVLTTENLDQALARSADDCNKGDEAARTAVEMVEVLRGIASGV